VQSDKKRMEYVMDMIEKQMDLTTLKKDKNYTKLYYWAVTKLTMMKPLYWSLVIVLGISAASLVAMAADGAKITLGAVAYFMGSPLFATVIVVFVLPRMVFKMNLKRRQEVYGDAYRVITNPNGLSIGGKVIPWDGKYTRWEGKYGIVMTRGMQIITLFPKHLYTEEEYQKVKGWLQLP